MSITDDIQVERQRQHELWDRHHEHGYGDCSHPTVDTAVKVAVLTEEVGEVARAFLAGNPANMRTELIQVAAVAVAIIEGIDALAVAITESSDQ